MGNIQIDFNKKVGPIKCMNAVNNGPVRLHNDEQKRTNFETFKSAHIPYVRTHDSSYCEMYGNEHTIDICAIFPDFCANPYKEESYDFVLTDDYIDAIMLAGSKVFYRLGTKIEQWIKKYATLPPADFYKWAIICEHVIKHFNEGWANGFHYNIEYWEIWNEPDLVSDDDENKRTWGGTAKEFYNFYEVVSVYLKNRFPNLKIGGPACAGVQITWIENFLNYLSADNKKPVLDFFSWHCYSNTPLKLKNDAETIRSILDKHGLQKTESIMNEWNYVRDWQDNYVYSLLSIIGMKGAAFTAAYMCVGQDAPVDMLMYYDARPCEMNGMFDFYSLYPIKGYYPFVAFDGLCNLKTEYECINTIPDIYAVSAGNEYGDQRILLSYYTDEDAKTGSVNVEMLLKGNYAEEYEIYLLDEAHDLEYTASMSVSSSGVGEISLRPNTVALLIAKSGK